MLIDDDIEDEPVLPEDVLASEEEIVQAIAHIRSNSAINARLFVAARFILGTTKRLKRECEPEDLLQEALLAILVGTRKWRTNRVDFKGLIVGVMRSMASSRDKTLLTKKTLNLTMEHELPLVGEEMEPLSLEEIAADPETIEEKLLKSEQEVMEVCQLAILRARYDSDSLHGRILDKVREGVVSHLEVREALSIKESEYRNAWKAIMRAAESLNSSAKE